MTDMPPPIVLNAGQQAAADGFFEFLFTEEKMMIISGPGGVGKTLLLGVMIDEILPMYFESCAITGIASEFNEVVMTATTNAAAEQLGAASGKATETIQSFLNLTVKDDYTTGRSKLTKTNNWIVHQNKIIFIDEAFMIDSPLLEQIEQGTHKCKIIFVGDHCQLAPVMERVSPITQLKVPFFELTEPMRNAEQPALMHLCKQLRETVETGVFKPIQIVPGVIDHLTDEQFQNLLDTNFLTEVDALEHRIGAYTNERVVDYNDYVRQLRSLGAAYSPGEKLINNSAIRMKNGMLSVETEVEIVGQSEVTEHLEIEPDVTMEVRKMDLKTKYGNVYTDIFVPVDRGHFNDLLKFYKKAKNWNRYYYLKNNFPDLRPRSAATLHKLQGSSVPNIYIDLTNLSTCRDPDQVARLLYVGASRARQRIFLYGTLADKFGGLTH